MTMNGICGVGILLIGIYVFGGNPSMAQGQSGGECSKFYRQLRRAGVNSHGRFDIPVDSEFPKFKLQVKFSRAVHSITFRQMKAKDVGAHREFSIDMLEPSKNGILTFNSVTRLRGIMGHTPRVTKIVYNGKSLCGGDSSASSTDPSSDTNVIDAPTSKVRFGLLRNRVQNKYTVSA